MKYTTKEINQIFANPKTIFKTINNFNNLPIDNNTNIHNQSRFRQLTRNNYFHADDEETLEQLSKKMGVLYKPTFETKSTSVYERTANIYKSYDDDEDFEEYVKNDIDNYATYQDVISKNNNDIHITTDGFISSIQTDKIQNYSENKIGQYDGIKINNNYFEKILKDAGLEMFKDFTNQENMRYSLLSPTFVITSYNNALFFLIDENEYREKIVYILNSASANEFPFMRMLVQNGKFQMYPIFKSNETKFDNILKPYKNSKSITKKAKQLNDENEFAQTLNPSTNLENELNEYCVSLGLTTNIKFDFTENRYAFVDNSYLDVYFKHLLKDYSNVEYNNVIDTLIKNWKTLYHGKNNDIFNHNSVGEPKHESDKIMNNYTIKTKNDNVENSDLIPINNSQFIKQLSAVNSLNLTSSISVEQNDKQIYQNKISNKADKLTTMKIPNITRKDQFKLNLENQIYGYNKVKTDKIILLNNQTKIYNYSINVQYRSQVLSVVNSKNYQQAIIDKRNIERYISKNESSNKTFVVNVYNLNDGRYIQMIQEIINDSLIIVPEKYYIEENKNLKDSLLLPDDSILNVHDEIDGRKMSNMFINPQPNTLLNMPIDLKILTFENPFTCSHFDDRSYVYKQTGYRNINIEYNIRKTEIQKVITENQAIREYLENL